MQKSEELETKLTPAAKQTLDEVVSEYRTRLLLDAGESASRLGELREISVHDIVTALPKQQKWLLSDGRQNVRDWLLAGVTASLIGAVTIADLAGNVGTLGSSVRMLSSPWLLAVVAGIAAAVLLIVAFSRARVVRLREIHQVEAIDNNIGAYISRWGGFEVALRRKAAIAFGESVASAPLSRLLDRFRMLGLFSEADFARIQDLLALRNSLAHGAGLKTADPRKLESASSDLARLTARLDGPYREVQN
jgi:hypothetical protein